MKTTTARRLLRLNRDFYDTFAAEFADSRSALQPGMIRALRGLGQFDSLVDIGCGNGRVGRALATGIVRHPVYRYVGVDFSPRLLERSARSQATLPAHFDFALCDLTRPAWAKGIDHLSDLFDAAVCFSMLHHVPGPRRRLRLLRDIRSLLRLGARCAISVWQFLHVPRLRRKIAAWSEVRLALAAVDEGDYLVDWRRGGRGLRYVHHFDEAELVDLCRRAGFSVLDAYRSDGRAAGDGMGLYIVLEAVIY